MIYRELGQTGKKISIVGLGGMRFFKKDEKIALATVRSCLDVGINFFETGVSYGDGESEKLIARALKDHAQREDIFLANKTHASAMPDAKQVRKELEAALQREQTDYFDLFSFWGTNTPEMFEDLKRAHAAMAE